jgi:hypothetical protein
VTRVSNSAVADVSKMSHTSISVVSSKILQTSELL